MAFNIFVSIYIVISLILTVQGLFSIYLMIYAWDDPKRLDLNRAPKKFLTPRTRFTVLLPARHEVLVISKTIQKIWDCNYPEELLELLIICENSDKETIEKVKSKIDEIRSPNISLIIFKDRPINKPHGLNKGLKHSKNEVVTIFDAEDIVHEDIFNVVNTVMLKEDVDVIQSGVQLMNYNSNWFSVLNVLEYFFWFKSRLHFHSKVGMIPLGGNTVFFKRETLNKVGGWDEKCLTEDADIGIRMSSRGAKVRVVYDDYYVTQEETPDTLDSLVRQRTRWNQGFLQIFKKGDWGDYPKFGQKCLAVYTLIFPITQAVMTLLLPLSILAIFKLKIYVFLSILLIFPAYLVIIQYALHILGLHEFTKSYKYKFSIFMCLKMAIVFLPYQWILGFAAFRSVYREVRKQNNWEKTKHTGAHHKIQPELKYSSFIDEVEYEKIA